MFSFLISILLCVLLVYIVNKLFNDFSFVERIISSFLIICGYLVLTLEISGLLNQLNKPIIVIFVQLAILLITIAVIRFSGIGFPKGISLNKITTRFMATINFLKKYKTILFFSIGIILIYVFQFILSMIFPQNTSDALYNHLSRIGYWLQQGSLKPYDGFTNYGSSFPYNNSLLMLWPISFLRSDFLVGFVQFFSSIIISLIIYEFSILLGFSKKPSILAGLTFLTFPAVILQATTAQNDLLATALIGASFLFLMKYFHHGVISRILLSSLSLGLAIGTKQYVFFILPGFFGLLIYYLFRRKREIRKELITWFVAILCCTLAFGMFAYLQNILHYRSFLGPSYVSLTSEGEFTNPRVLFKKLPLNSARLFTQFISCEGLMSTHESKCLSIKNTVLNPVFSIVEINVESDDYLLEKNQSFSIDRRYPLNEESSWYGITSWVLILPSVFVGFFYFIIKKKYDALFLLFTSLMHFSITSVFKSGWDPYMGRYLMISIALIMPYTAHIFSFFDKTVLKRLLIFVFSALCLFVITFSLVNNVSKPLVSKRQIEKMLGWDSILSPIIDPIAYRLDRLINNRIDIWNMSDSEIKTFGALDFQPPLYLVENYVPGDSTLIVIAEKTIVMDYLFFGDDFSREIIPISHINHIPTIQSNEVYILLSPDFELTEEKDYRFIADKDDWKLYQQDTK